MGGGREREKGNYFFLLVLLLLRVVTRLWRDPALTASRSDRADVAVEKKRKKTPDDAP